MTNIKGLGTDMVPEKTRVTGLSGEQYPEAKRIALRNEYDLSMNNDLLQLSDFSRAFMERLDRLIDLINALHAIPNR